MVKGPAAAATAGQGHSVGGGGSRSKNNKSKALTYLLWLVGGVCGLHHFYLGRDLQGVLWWCTFGGYFGFGWLRDVFYIGEYVADANRDEKYMKKVDYMVRVHGKVSTTRN
jgi:DnaJ family protein C protein 22|uniref:DnaJ subfamily C member 22 n=1 Tax=Sipha flava TaxID=143950 RepID=A0A2S2QFG1_9HEMI